MQQAQHYEGQGLAQVVIRKQASAKLLARLPFLPPHPSCMLTCLELDAWSSFHTLCGEISFYCLPLLPRNFLLPMPMGILFSAYLRFQPRVGPSVGRSPPLPSRSISAAALVLSSPIHRLSSRRGAAAPR